MPAVTAQHDAAAWDVQSASVASANSLAGDSIKLDGEHAARPFAELIVKRGDV